METAFKKWFIYRNVHQIQPESPWSCMSWLLSRQSHCGTGGAPVAQCMTSQRLKGVCGISIQVMNDERNPPLLHICTSGRKKAYQGLWDISCAATVAPVLPRQLWFSWFKRQTVRTVWCSGHCATNVFKKKRQKRLFIKKLNPDWIYCAKVK